VGGGWRRKRRRGGVDACAVEVTAVGRDAPIFDVDDEIARG